jgi:hypothetical protein
MHVDLRVSKEQRQVPTWYETGYGSETHIRTAVGDDMSGGAFVVRHIRQKAGAIPGNDIHPEVAL